MIVAEVVHGVHCMDAGLRAARSMHGGGGAMESGLSLVAGIIVIFDVVCIIIIFDMTGLS